MYSYDGQFTLYDEIGNPTSYMGSALTWEQGRLLKSFDDTDFAYNSGGSRIYKEHDGVGTYYWTYYYLEGNTIIREERVYPAGHTMQSGDVENITYYYSGLGTMVGFGLKQYNVAVQHYYFILNAQGDVVALYQNKTGGVVARYTYDSWGKILDIKDGTGASRMNDPAFVGNINPTRYRGYYHDAETGLYYLLTRYYDPNTGRFVNAGGNIASGLGRNAHFRTSASMPV